MTNTIKGVRLLFVPNLFHMFEYIFQPATRCCIVERFEFWRQNRSKGHRLFRMWHEYHVSKTNQKNRKSCIMKLSHNLPHARPQKVERNLLHKTKVKVANTIVVNSHAVFRFLLL